MLTSLCAYKILHFFSYKLNFIALRTRWTIFLGYIWSSFIIGEYQAHLISWYLYDHTEKRWKWLAIIRKKASIESNSFMIDSVDEFISLALLLY